MLSTAALISDMRPLRLQPTAKYTCRACHTVFVREDRFLAHKCKQMKREEEFHSPAGQAAWNYYQQWLREMKRLPPSAGQSFMSSKFFRTFINFVTFTKTVELPRPEKFIWLMVQKNFPPALWQTDEVYSMYLEFLDRKVPPLEQANLSVETLFSYAEKHDVDVSDVFTKLHPADLIQMLRTRRLSPWLLLCTTKFGPYFRNQTNPEQRIIIENLIRADFWYDKMEQHAEDVLAIKKVVQAMGL